MKPMQFRLSSILVLVTILSLWLGAVRSDGFPGVVLWIAALAATLGTVFMMHLRLSESLHLFEAKMSGRAGYIVLLVRFLLIVLFVKIFTYFCPWV